MKTICVNPVKKIVLSLLMVCISYWGWTATYYVSSTGNDSNSGLTSALAWQTLTKVNSRTFTAGDQILFKRGDTFYGTLTTNQAGTSGNPITYSAYGTGENPIITGFTSVTAWTNLGGNIWESTNAVSTLSTTCNMVAIGGVNTAMGRYPNDDYDNGNGAYFEFTAHNATSMTVPALTGTPNFDGGEIVAKRARYFSIRQRITTQTGSILNFVSSDMGLTDNMGIIIQDHPNTLDKQNEWYYNPSTKKIRVYSTTQPTNVKIATTEHLIDFGNNLSTSSVRGNYITIDGLDLIGCNGIGLYCPINIKNHQNSLVVRNCNIFYTGSSGADLQGNGYFFENNTIKDVQGHGIKLASSQNILIKNNVIENVGTLFGMSPTIGAFNGISAIGSYNVNIEGNTLRNLRYNGINFSQGADVVTIKNNFIDNFCLLLDDGGGIYGGSNASIIGNVVLNGNSPWQGTLTPNSSESVGIYIDDHSDHNIIEYNSIANVAFIGMYLHNASYNTVRYNTIYNSGNAQFCLKDDANLGTINDNLITNNIFFAANPYDEIGLYRFNTNTFTAIGTTDYNYYCRPFATNAGKNEITITYNPSTLNTYKDLAWWKSVSGQDAHSLGSPQIVSNENDLQFEYNASKTVKTISLSRPMIDVKGTKYATSVTLQPNTSIVLIKDNKPAKYSSEYKSICEGSSYFSWTTTGKYERTLMTESGVDSIVTTYLTVNPNYSVNETVTILAGENYNSWTKSGQYIRNLNSVSGCDSVVTTNLIVDINSVKVGETITQTIALKKGNNMISTFLQATNPDISAITQTIRDSGVLIKMQNESGNSYENWGILGGWINNLGSLQNTEGYKIMVANDCTLQITGQQIALPLDIPLNAGWNIISFPRADILDAKLIIQALIDQNKLVKVQDETGNSIEDWGSFGGWKNSIGNFLPGKAYRVKVSANTILTIHESYPKSIVAPVYAEQTQHFYSLAEGNGSDHMNINIVDLDQAGFSVGDELAAFDGDLCVGAFSITEQHLIDGTASLIASCSSDNQRKDGFIEGSSIQLKVWDHITVEESGIQISVLNGSANYFKNESILCKLKSLTTSVPNLEAKIQIEIFPNPSQGRFTVSLSEIPVSGSRIDVYDLSGRKITSRLITGITEEIDITGQAAGMYLVKSILGSKENINKLVIQR